MGFDAYMALGACLKPYGHALIIQSRIVTQKWQEPSVSASDTEFLSDAALQQPKG